MATKEEIRLAKEPFKTMCLVTDEETLNELRGWREPTTAYVLFESVVFRSIGDGAFKKGKSLFTLNVENRPEQSDKVYYYIRKGFRPIHMANFPRHDSVDPVRAQKAQLYSGPGKRNPWDILASLVRQEMGTGSERDGIKAENLGLAKKLQEAREQIASLESKKVKAKDGAEKSQTY